MIYRYFLAFWIFISSIVAVQSTQYGLLGETVTFKTDITDPPDDILWKHNGNKVVHFDGSKQISYSLFENRVAVDWHSAELEVNHLTHSDSGQYEMDAAYKGRVIRLKFELRVLDRVTKPTIICHMTDGSSSDKSGSEATLMCSTNTSQSLNYEWSQPGKNQSGQILTIPLGTEHDDKVYSCTVSNRLSKEIATFTAKDCYPVGVSAGLITGLIIGVIVILLCVLGAVFCALKHKACFAKKEKTDAEQPHSDHASDQPSEPLLHRTETRPSSQRLHHLGEIGKNSNYDHKDEKHNELDPQTEKGLEINGSKPEKIGPPVPKRPHFSKVNQGQADVNDDHLQSPTASENSGLENNKVKPNTIKPALPKKPPSVKISKGQTDSNPPSKDKVSEVGCFEEHSGATESDLQSVTAAQKPVVGEEVNSQQVTGEKQENESVEMTKKEEPPTIPEPTGLENNEGKPEKIGPPVPNKPHLSKVNQGQADVNDDDLQSPTASEKPDGI